MGPVDGLFGTTDASGRVRTIGFTDFAAIDLPGGIRPNCEMTLLIGRYDAEAVLGVLVRLAIEALACDTETMRARLLRDLFSDVLAFTILCLFLHNMQAGR